MADVASLAGVSAATAARVLHQNGYVSQENRGRVLKALAESGYRPNLQARSLRLKRSFTLGLVLLSARDNPFFTNVSHAIRTAAMDRGFSMLTVNHGNSDAVEAAGVRQFLEHNVEAVILCHAWNSQNYAAITAAGIPVIEIERSKIAQSYLIAIDPSPGIAEAVNTLVGAGHRRIAFIGSTPVTGKLSTSDDPRPEVARAEAFLAATASAGLKKGDCPVELGSYYPSPGNLKPPGYEQAVKVFDRAKRAVTGVIAGSDIMAAGILQALYDRRLRVPEDVSLIGYDDSLAQFLTPPLSSVAQPYAEIGQAVMERLEGKGKRGSGNSPTPNLRTTLNVRSSVSSPRRS